MHVEEYLTQVAIIEFTRVQVDLVPPDGGLLDVAFTAIWQTRARGRPGFREFL